LFGDVKSLEDVDNVDTLHIASRGACDGCGSKDGEVFGLHVCE
jgi:Fe-S cluster biogenesis protein NfuA